MNEELLFYATVGAYLIATFLYLGYILSKNKMLGDAASAVTLLGFVANTATLAVRTINVGHAPFSNMYEFSTSFAWGIVAVYIWAEYRYKFKSIGAFVMPLAFLLIASTDMLGISKDVKPLMPALKSNWMTIHVATAVIAYGAYALSAGLAVMYLLKEKMEKTKSKSFFNKELPEARILDDLSHRFIAFAFPFMSAVIISGAVWAEYAWGRYWSWDPKETWSLITWLVYSAYLHARFTYGWKGRRAAWLAIIGFITVLFTYFGVNILLSGLHSYGGV